MLKKFLKGFLKWLVLPLFVLILLLTAYYQFIVKFSPPAVQDQTSLNLKREVVSDNHFKIGNNWLLKNTSGVWEMYVEGKPFERGVINGKLATELVQNQEEYFVSSIKNLIPSENYLKFLKYFTVWFNRNMPNYVRLDYQEEIFGISHSFSPKFNFIGSNYERNLNYHAAHDIGHALQEMGLVVGCTSFSVWGDKSEDGSLIIGRNFDFYTGDDFAKDKIVMFTRPYSGYGFMTVTWGGFIGATSGMNEKGLTVTLNAAKSNFPTYAATPISLLAREILQFAQTIDEAFAIAQKRKTFVAESIMIGSAADGKTAIIEKSPKRTAIVYPKENKIVCSNHYQSPEFNSDTLNMSEANATTSAYRFKRVNELLSQKPKLNETQTAAILRSQKGLNDAFFGYGNEKAINQLLCHHSVIFKPQQQLVWVSTQPFQLGKYICYDLKKIFDKPATGSYTNAVVDSLTIEADTFLVSKEFKDYQTFHQLKLKLQSYLRGRGDFSQNEAEVLVATNPELYQSYWLAGDFYTRNKEMAKAQTMYKAALTKQIPRVAEREAILKLINK